MDKIAALQQEKNDAIRRCMVLVNAGLSTEEQRAEHTKLTTRMNEIEDDLVSLRKIDSHFAKQPAPAPVAAPSPAPKVEVIASPGEERAQRARVNAAWRSYLETGERRDLSESGTGAALLPQEFSGVFTEAQKFYGPIGAMVKQEYEPNGRLRKLVISDDTASTMTYVAEDGSTASGVEEDPTLSSTIPGTDALVTRITYSIQALDDAFDLEGFLRSNATVRVSRAIEWALTVGQDNGTNTPLPNSPTGGLLAGVSAGVTQGALADGVSYSALSQLAGTVDYQYRINGSFMVNPTTFTYLTEQVDSTGRPLYAFGDDGLLYIAGKPVQVNAAMASYSTASKPAVLFGDFSRQYAYLNGGGVRIKILSENVGGAENFKRTMLVYHRIGAAQLLTNAVKSFVTAAS